MCCGLVDGGRSRWPGESPCCTVVVACVEVEDEEGELVEAPGSRRGCVDSRECWCRLSAYLMVTASTLSGSPIVGKLWRESEEGYGLVIGEERLDADVRLARKVELDSRRGAFRA